MHLLKLLHMLLSMYISYLVYVFNIRHCTGCLHLIYSICTFCEAYCIAYTINSDAYLYLGLPAPGLFYNNNVPARSELSSPAVRQCALFTVQCSIHPPPPSAICTATSFSVFAAHLHCALLTAHCTLYMS